MFICASAFAAGPAVTNQKWRCYFNDQKSAYRLIHELNIHPSYRSNGKGDFFGMHLGDVTSFSVTIKDGNVVDGELIGAEGNPTDKTNWDLKETLDAMAVKNKPYSGHNISVYDSAITKPEIKNDKVQFSVSYDAYDHYSYDLKIDAKTKTAIIDSSSEIDCRGSALGTAVYDCY